MIYKNHQQKNPYKNFQLSDCFVREMNNDSASFLFELAFPNQLMVLRAETEHEMKKWIRFLNYSSSFPIEHWIFREIDELIDDTEEKRTDAMEQTFRRTKTLNDVLHDFEALEEFTRFLVRILQQTRFPDFL